MRAKTKTEHGYILVFVGKEHHLADVRGYAYEHRVVMESKIGRKLLSSELVHHIDENPENNDPTNLELTTRAEHVRHHNPVRFRKFTRSNTCKRGHIKDLKKPNGKVECRFCARAYDRKRIRPPKPRVLNSRTGEHNRIKTHCPMEHPYSPENTRTNGKRRICKTCHRLREKARNDRRRDEFKK